MTVLCQWCGAANPDDREACAHCNLRLIVVSGADTDTDALLAGRQAEEEGEPLTLDEHLLERLTGVEDAVRRLGAALVRQEERLAELERSVSLLDAGMQALVELLDRRKLVREGELLSAWERAATSEMTRRELLDLLRKRREGLAVRLRAAGRQMAPDLDRALQTAELSLLAGQPERAAEILTAAFARHPRTPELAELIGELAVERGDRSIAVVYLQETLRLAPDNLNALIHLGTLLTDAGRLAEARRHLERALALAPDAFLPHFSLGAHFASAGDIERARHHLRQAVDRDEMPQALVLLGMVELDAGRPQAAIDALERAVELGGDMEEAIFYLGLAYLERRWHRKALDCFRRVLAMDPQRLQYQEAVRLLEGGRNAPPPMPAHLLRLVRDLSGEAEAGRVERAMQRLRKAAGAVEHPTLLASLALLAAATGRHRQALAAAHRLLRQERRGAPLLAAWTALFETLRAARRFSALQRCGERLLRDSREDSERGLAAYELALGELERGGDTRRALELAHTSLRLIPRELRQYPLSALGRIHLARREHSDAVDFLEQAAALQASPAILTQLGLALLELGERDRAREFLRRARSEADRDLKTDVLSHLARVGWLAGHGRRRG
ncbi:MAG TPA: tetratricopeptide repeat protein [Thermoanaerobaculaceae bacterium]|nr:tetratricopeptide repeat protein [Thermoanaerobaculaceae bacterium]HRS16674.1 tetratricopeptide repeat protein [Thermoanaerobaculaceae bacterium]